MPASVFGNRFLSYREAAWHKLGLVLEERMGAVEALEKIGEYTVYTEALQTISGVPINHRAILRAATPDDPQIRTFGVVGPDYSLVTPREVCEVWDKSINVPVETLGALHNGETIFITTKLDTTEIRGDEVENYLLIANPMTGGGAAQVMVTPVRVVCANTLMVGEKMATEKYRIIHDQYVMDRLSNWLEGAYNRTVEKSRVLEEAFNVLANYYVKENQVNEILETAYPIPKQPSQNVLEFILQNRVEVWEKTREKVLARRNAAKELFEGRGIGMDSVATKGTAWGLYNSIAELENYRRGRQPEVSAYNSIFGDRAKTMQKSFEKVMSLV